MALPDMYVFAGAFGVSAFAGLAALVRSQSPITVRTVASTIMNMGVIGLGLALVYFSKFQDNLYFLIGLCCFAGFGGSMTLDFVLDKIKSKLGKETPSAVPPTPTPPSPDAGKGETK